MLLLAIALAAPVQPTKTWVGEYVMARRDEVPLTAAGKDDPLAQLHTEEVFLVREDKGDKVRLRASGKIGWAAKDDLVRIPDARAYFTEKIKAAPTEAVWYARRGRARGALPKPDRDAALADLTEAVRLDPGNYLWPCHRGWLRLNRHEYKKAADDFDAVIKLAPGKIDGYLGRGYARQQQNLLFAASDDFDKAVETAPEDAAGHSAWGRMLADRRLFAAAEAEFARSVELSPDDPTALLARAKGRVAAKKYAAAVEDCDAAIKMDGGDPDGFTGRAWAWQAAKEYDKALADADRANWMAPSATAPRRIRAAVLARQKKYAAAKAEYAAALNLDPNDPDTQSEFAWVLATSPDGKNRDGKRAVELAAEAVKRDPTWGHRDSLAAAHAETGDFPRAVAEQTAAMAANNDPDEKKKMEARLALYEAKKPYRDED